LKKNKKEVAGTWTKASDLKVGQMIAVAGEDGRIAFERIVSIERASPEQVYGIQISNAGNFVGNGIIVGDRTRRGKKLQKADK